MIPNCYRNLFRLLPLVAFITKSRRRSGVFNTVLGEAWNVLNPLAQLGIYYFLVEVVFQRTGDYPTKPALFIIVGITHYIFLQRSLTLGASSIFGNERLLLQVRIEPLAFIGIAVRQALTDLLVGLALCVGFFVFLGPPEWHFGLLLYPLVMFALFVVAWSWAVILGTLSVYVRDLPNLLAIVMRLMLYATPVIYPLAMLPERFRELMGFNPLAAWYGLLHWSLFGAELPGAAHLISFGIFLIGSLVASHMIYRSLQPRFTKVL